MPKPITKLRTLLKQSLPVSFRHAARQKLAYPMRPLIRAYIQRTPWRYGKTTLYDFYDKHIAWLPYDTTVLTRLGIRMRLQFPDMVSRTIYATGLWEPVITRYIENSLRPGDIFVDVGANIGYYSLIASKEVGTAGKVFAVEASPTNYRRMLKNLALNQFANIHTVNAAASSSRGELPIYLAPPTNRGHSTTVISLAEGEDMQFEAMVHADTIENLIGSPDLRNARLVKIDVEGAERSVLEPLFGSLDRFSPRTEWLLELAPGYSSLGQSDVDDIYHAFTSHGYRAYVIPNRYNHRFLTSAYAEELTLVPLTSAPRERVVDVLMTRSPISGCTQ